MRIVVIMPALGDYHLPRLEKLGGAVKKSGWELVVLVLNRRSAFYSHPQERSIRDETINLIWVDEQGSSRKLLALYRTLSKLAPSVIFQMGYHTPSAWIGLLAAKLLRAKIFFFSDSKSDDQKRNPIVETLKSILVRAFDGALVAGERHRQYFSSLGLASARIATGYDVVDNNFFSRRANRFRAKARLFKDRIAPFRYVLVVSRLVDRKRLDRSIELYKAAALSALGIHLVIVGSGPLRSDVLSLAERFGIGDFVHILSDIPNTRMPLLYAFADMLWLNSEYDQWGLCVNEAMACGVVCVVTERCGCAGELVIDGENGCVWNGADLSNPTEFVIRYYSEPALQARLGNACVERMKHWDLDRYANGCLALASGKV